LLEKKMLGEHVWNIRLEAGAKSERAMRKLENKLPPFSRFFFCCFLMCFVFFVFEKKKTMATRHCLLL
jgi:hypothetical protein